MYKQVYLRTASASFSSNSPAIFYVFRAGPDSAFIFHNNMSINISIRKWKIFHFLMVMLMVMSQCEPALTLYPLRRTAIFSKSVNVDSLPVYYIPFKSYWSAHLRNVINSYEGRCHFERNLFKMQKRKTSKMCQPPNVLRSYLILKLLVQSLM